MEDDDNKIVFDSIGSSIGEVQEEDEEVLSKCVLPKRPVPSFFLFCRDKKDELPSMALLERTQILSQMWKAASDEDKKVYVDANTLEKQRYRNEVTALQKKHPNALKILLARKRSKQKAKSRKHRIPTNTMKDKSPPKKRGRKRKRAPSPSVLSHSPVSSPTKLPSTKQSPTKQSPTKQSPTKQSPTKLSPTKQSPAKLSPTKQSPTKLSPVQQQSLPLPQQVIVPDTDIAIFTPEFLEYNKKLNSQLLQMRKTNNDLQSEVSRLEDSISDQEKTLNGLQDKLKTFKEESQALERNRQKLEDSIFNSFGSLANERTSREITSAEQLLDTLLANGVNAKAIGLAVKSFIAP